MAGRVRWLLLPPGSDVTSQCQSCWGDEMSEAPKVFFLAKKNTVALWTTAAPGGWRQIPGGLEYHTRNGRGVATYAVVGHDSEETGFTKRCLRWLWSLRAGGTKWSWRSGSCLSVHSFLEKILPNVSTISSQYTPQFLSEFWCFWVYLGTAWYTKKSIKMSEGFWPLSMCRWFTKSLNSWGILAGFFLVKFEDLPWMVVSLFQL